MKPYLLPAIALMILLVQGCAKPPYHNIDNQQLQTLMEQGVPLYDIRLPEEWRETGVIKGSHKLTFFDPQGRINRHFLPKFTKDVAKDKPVAVMCHVGSRSAALAGYLMEEHGYTTVYNVKDGIDAWIREGRPVVGKYRR